MLPKKECTNDFWLQHARNVTSLKKTFAIAVSPLFRSRVVSNAAARGGVIPTPRGDGKHCVTPARAASEETSEQAQYGLKAAISNCFRRSDVGKFCLALSKQSCFKHRFYNIFALFFVILLSESRFQRLWLNFAFASFLLFKSLLPLNDFI